MVRWRRTGHHPRRAVEATWGEEFTLRRYHDQALSYGSPPVKYVRALILGEAIPGL